jgi:hypothetical protein
MCGEKRHDIRAAELQHFERTAVLGAGTSEIPNDLIAGLQIFLFELRAIRAAW